MSKLIRMDHTGHSTLAEWTPDDPAAVEAAVAAFRAELDRGYLGDGQHRARPRRAVRELPVDAAARDPAPADLRRLTAAGPTAMATVDVLPETAAVHWRRRVDAAQLRLRGRLWTLTMVAHVVPFAGAATLLMWVQPLALPVALVCLAHAWIIPELYAQRGANVLRPPRRHGGARAAEPEQRSVGLLGDLVGHDARELHARTGLVVEPGRLGTWLVGEAGARPPARPRRPAFCYCVKVDPRRPARRAALRRPHRAPAARPAQRRAGLRHRRQPRLRGRALAAAPAHAASGRGRR